MMIYRIYKDVFSLKRSLIYIVNTGQYQNRGSTAHNRSISEIINYWLN